mgnify:CR=1 FL=1
MAGEKKSRAKKSAGKSTKKTAAKKPAKKTTAKKPAKKATAKKSAKKTAAKKPAKKTAAKKSPAEEPSGKPAQQPAEKATEKTAEAATQAELVDIEEIARQLKLPLLRVRKMVRSGQIRGVKIDGQWQFNPRLVHAMLGRKARGG